MLRTVASGLAMLALPIAAHTHDDAGELGHHWDVPAYTQEIHAQITVIVVIAAVAAFSILTSRVLKARKVSKQ